MLFYFATKTKTTSQKVIISIHSDRIRTTNNMLGDCYAAAVVEQLSKKELMALDAAVIYQVIYSFSENKTL